MSLDLRVLNMVTHALCLLKGVFRSKMTAICVQQIGWQTRVPDTNFRVISSLMPLKASQTAALLCDYEISDFLLKELFMILLFSFSFRLL